MALWDRSICSSSRSSSPAFPPPHKGCSQPAAPGGHRAVTRGEEMSSERDPLPPPSPFLPLRSSCLSFHLISCSLGFFVSIPKLVMGCWGSREGAAAWRGWGWMGEDGDALRPQGLRRGDPHHRWGCRKPPMGGPAGTFKLVPPGRHSFSPALRAILSCPGDLYGEQFTIVFW